MAQINSFLMYSDTWNRIRRDLMDFPLPEGRKWAIIEVWEEPWLAWANLGGSAIDSP